MMVCKTDQNYLQVAVMVYGVLSRIFKKEFKGSAVRAASVGVALYFEDRQSRGCQWEAFTTLYRRMYGEYLPFYGTTGPEDPSAPLDSLRFVIWHSLKAEDRSSTLNPMSTSVKKAAEQILAQWEDIKDTVPANEELGDYLFSEDTILSPTKLPGVFSWLMCDSYLGRWYANDDLLSRPVPMLDDYIGLVYASPDERKSARRLYLCNESRIWPLSLSPQKVYATMIREDMEDPADRLASVIEKLSIMPFQVFSIVSRPPYGLVLKDVYGKEYRVKVENGNLAGIHNPLYRNYVGKIITLDGKYWILYLNGGFGDSEDYFASFRKERMEERDLAEERVKRQKMIMEKNKGERVYFFNNLEEVENWYLKNADQELDVTPLMKSLRNVALAVVLPDDNGKTGTIILDRTPEVLDSLRNRYFNEFAATGILAEDLGSSSHSFGTFIVLMREGMFTHAEFSTEDLDGSPGSKTILQDNMDFVMRCLRRDFPTEEITRPSQQGKFDPAFAAFLKELREVRTFHSRSNTEWVLKRADGDMVVLRSKKGVDCEIPAGDLFAAYTELNKKEMTIDKLRPFVGKDNASAAAAVLYSTWGTGRNKNTLQNMAKTFQIFFKGL